MEKIVVELGERSYPIHIGAGALSDGALLGSCITATQVLVVTNDVVAPLYLEKLTAALPADTSTLVVPDGEEQKNLGTFSAIIDRLVELGFHRDACLVALGGGVIGDVAGFAAACYQRGIDFVQLPTTLLAQVDSSVGGKTAVNHSTAKNMIGAFYQPKAVLSDTSTLATLPPRELSAGLAEVIKHGLILDAEFFEWLEDGIDDLLGLQEAALTHAIRRCCEIKAAIVAEDERERGRRALLNLGHTFGHALENVCGYGTLLHGEAVAVGISIAARLSAELGLVPESICDRIDTLLQRAALPVSAAGVDADRVLDAMRIDKKAGRGGLRLVLLNDLGDARVTAAPDEGLLRRVIVAKTAG